MSAALDNTHAPDARSWVASAQRPGTDFPLQNLPHGVFRLSGEGESAWRGGVAIGDEVLDLAALARLRIEWPDGRVSAALQAAALPLLNDYLALGRAHWRALRAALFDLLLDDPYAAPEAQQRQARLLAAQGGCLVPQSACEFRLPARVGDYTDFYTSIHHATNIGRLFRPDNPLLPNYRWVPIGYHGRASSLVVSGEAVPRPLGQTLAPGAEQPVFGPCKRLDFELELGVVVGPGNARGQSISMEQAEDHVFGLCLLNDWSARDIQGWEYQPLGPFLSKNFATTLSPWIVTLEALAPYRLPFERAAGEPQPLPYLDSPANRAHGVLDIALAVDLQTEAMRQHGSAAECISRSNYRHAYWTVAQLVSHHTVGGCNLQPGDLLGTGTLSGPEPGSGGALIELTQGGRQPLTLPNGQQRTFLEDGDAVALRAWCEREGRARIGFGECVGRVGANPPSGD